jgi:hypothetical protein
MQSYNKIDAALAALEELHWLDGLCAQLSSLHRKYGQPDLPTSAISRVPKTLPFLKPEMIERVVGYEQLAADAYNMGVKVAFRCVGWEYVGLLTAIANETRSTPDWSAYYAEAVAVIESFFQSGAGWEEFTSYLLEPAQNYLASKQ